MSNRFSREDALDALTYLDAGAYDRDDWARIAMAAKDAGIEFADFNAWSAQADNYDSERDTRTMWKGIKDGAVGAGTLFHIALERGWKPATNDAHGKPISSRPSRSAPRPADSAHTDKRAKQAQDEAIEREQNMAKARGWLSRILSEASPATDDHPYLQRKQINGDGLLCLPLARIHSILGYKPAPSKRGELTGDSILIAPMHLGDGVPVTAELIDGDGRKYGLAHLPRSGAMWGPASLNNPALIGIAEGIATTKTCAGATPCPTFAAGSAGNIEDVLFALRERYPESEFILFADLANPDKPSSVKAQEKTQALAASMFYPCVLPDPAQMPEGGTDFNDMAVHAGDEAVWGWIEAQRVPTDQISWLRAAETRLDIDYVLPSLPLGSVGLIAGPGSVGKTYFALDLIASVALGRSLSNIEGGFSHLRPGKTAILLGEDPPEIIHNRLHAMAKAHFLSDVALCALERAAKVISMVGEDMRLIQVAQGNFITDADFLLKLEKLCHGRRLVILDPLIRLHDGPENDNNVANKLMLNIQRAALKNRCSILLLHHVGKGDKESWQASRGASAYTTSVRWQMNVLPPNKDEIEQYHLDQNGRDPRHFIKCTGVKMNYGSYVNEFWMIRRQDGVLFHLPIEDLGKTPFNANPFPPPRNVGGNGSGSGDSYSAGQNAGRKKRWANVNYMDSESNDPD